MMSKKIDRFKQWAGERMGQEQKTVETSEFKELEAEMSMRFEGIEKLHITSTNYLKNLAKKREGDDKEKVLLVQQCGNAMASHGSQFEHESALGQGLLKLGMAHQKIAKAQESFTNVATDTWVESLERSLRQMKEYQAARRKLETRRLNYDSSLTKAQKAKKEDFRLDEELRSQKFKYEESCEDVTRRMTEIQDTEAGTLEDLTLLFEAEITYFDQCRDTLLQIQSSWPNTYASVPKFC